MWHRGIEIVTRSEEGNRDMKTDEMNSETAGLGN